MWTSFSMIKIENEMLHETYNIRVDNSRWYTDYTNASFSRQPPMENTTKHDLQSKGHDVYDLLPECSKFTYHTSIYCNKAMTTLINCQGKLWTCLTWRKQCIARIMWIKQLKQMHPMELESIFTDTGSTTLMFCFQDYFV